jgi:single-strand DNA-binding protein
VTTRKQVGGQWQDVPCWIDCKVFEKQAENAAQYLKKGDEVAIQGRLDLEEWKADDGTKRSVHVVVAHGCDYLRKADAQGAQRNGNGNGAARSNGNGNSNGNGRSSQPPSSSKPSQQGNSDAFDPFADDLPF